MTSLLIELIDWVVSTCSRQQFVASFSPLPGAPSFAFLRRVGIATVCSRALTRVRKIKSGGESGIRTHVRVSPKHAFQACAFSHSAISPAQVGTVSLYRLMQMKAGVPMTGSDSAANNIRSARALFWSPARRGDVEPNSRWFVNARYVYGLFHGFGRNFFHGCSRKKKKPPLK